MSLPDTLDFVLNILSSIAIITSVFTVLFLMFNKFSSGLRYVLLPCGINFFSRLRVLFICRKTYTKKRAFLEFAILRTQGKATIAREWRTIINEFKSFYSEDESKLVYNIPNCSWLIGNDLNAAVERYFGFLQKEGTKKALGLKDDLYKWIIKIHVDEAYITPTCLISGLLAQYEQNWEEYIKKYITTAYSTESNRNASNSVLPTELYLTFAWLLWGPSYELNYKEYWAGLCQMSYCDESNSIPIVANKETDQTTLLKNRLDANENNGKRYGALVSAELSIFEKRAYFNELKKIENANNSYFYKKVQYGDAPFAAQLDSFLPYENYKSKKYYCTAYVWLLFELEDDASSEFQPEKAVAFFEHANLADDETYLFLIDSLIDKSLNYFKDIFEDPALCDRKYRFVASLNERISDYMKKRYIDLMESDTEFGKQLSNGVYLEPKRTPSTVFSAFDNFFTKTNQFTFVDVQLTDKNSIVDLGVFYTDVYLDCFPDLNERESLDNILFYLQQNNVCQGYSYHVLLIKDTERGKAVGGVIFDYFEKTNSAVIEFIAINKAMQSSGLGSELLKKVDLILSADANKANKREIDYVFCEIDSPNRENNDDKYLYFWNKNNFKHLGFSYIQPALSKEKDVVRNLWLIVSSKRNSKALSNNVVKDFLFDYMKYCMKIDDPLSNAEYKEMIAELDAKDSLELRPIFE